MKFSKSEKWIAGLCSAAMCSWGFSGYMKYTQHEVVMWYFICLGALLAVVALGIEMEEWPFSLWLSRTQSDKPPPTVTVQEARPVVRAVSILSLREEAALEIPAFQRCSRAKAIQRSLEAAFAPQEVAQQQRVDEVVFANVPGGRHR